LPRRDGTWIVEQEIKSSPNVPITGAGATNVTEDEKGKKRSERRAERRNNMPLNRKGKCEIKKSTVIQLR